MAVRGSGRAAGAGRRAPSHLVTLLVPILVLHPAMDPASVSRAGEPPAASAAILPSAAPPLRLPSETGSFRVRLLSHIAPSAFPSGSTTANDITGYVSPTGREYAVVGLRKGTGFVDVTDPAHPEIVADIPDAESLWSDMDVYDQFAYSVTEASGGMQVIDLSGIDGGSVILVGTAPGGFATAHTIFVNQKSGYLYACATNINLGFIIFDLTFPHSPEPVGSWVGGIAHEIFPVSYDECPYAARAGQPCEIVYMFAANAGLRVIDVTDKSSTALIGLLRYPNLAYCHQGWMTQDRRYLLLGDEQDETRFNLPATTYVIDVANPAAPAYVTTFTNGLNSIDHNLMVRGRFLFEANYTTGLRVFDIADVNNAREIGYYDTFPANDGRTYDGAWGVYAGLPSGTVLVSDISGGLFVFDVQEATGCQSETECDDHDPCTDDACSPDRVCVHVPRPVGASCVDRDPCTKDGVCDESGHCISTVVSGLPCEEDAECFPGLCDSISDRCVCGPCERALPPSLATPAVARNRYLSLRPTNGGTLAALRVTMTDGPSELAGCKGVPFWIGEPRAVSEQAGLRDDTPPVFIAAPASDEPFFADWGTMGTVNVFGRAIGPGATYRVEMVTASCWSIGAASFSLALHLKTGMWGDVVGTCSSGGCTAPDGRLDVPTDAGAIVDKYINRPLAKSKTWTDLEPAVPDQLINITDLMVALDAYRGSPYPFAAAAGCR